MFTFINAFPRSAEKAQAALGKETSTRESFILSLIHFHIHHPPTLAQLPPFYFLKPTLLPCSVRTFLIQHSTFQPGISFPSLWTNTASLLDVKQQTNNSPATSPIPVKRTGIILVLYTCQSQSPSQLQPLFAYWVLQ